MNRSSRLASELVALLAIALASTAFPARDAVAAPLPSAPVPEVPMRAETIQPEVDPALVAWREHVLPAIRDFLAAERTELAGLAEPARLAAADASPGDATQQRAAAARLEERKLRGEHHVLALQADWAREWGRQDLALRLQARLQALEAACPALAEAAGTDAEVAR